MTDLLKARPCSRKCIRTINKVGCGGSRAEVVGRCSSAVILHTVSWRQSRRVLQMNSLMQGGWFSMREKEMCQELKYGRR